MRLDTALSPPTSKQLRSQGTEVAALSDFGVVLLFASRRSNCLSDTVTAEFCYCLLLLQVLRQAAETSGAEP